MWATDTYSKFGVEYAAEKQMTPALLSGLNANIIQPRIAKALNDQQDRTKKHAEVFTPAWICNKMNNQCDEVWFGRSDVFNKIEGHSWTDVDQTVIFPKRKTWKHYVDSRRIEITCGEAPYLVSRYDAASGEEIAIPHRVGILDRKLRIVNENAADESEWLKWSIRAFQSVYGYEFQGDNLLIARVNLLMSFSEYLADKWNRQASKMELKKIANIIAWNIWQMDGLKGIVPYGVPREECHQMTLFDIPQPTEQNGTAATNCRIYDWRKQRSIFYSDMQKGR